MSHIKCFTFWEARLLLQSQKLQKPKSTEADVIAVSQEPGNSITLWAHYR